MRAVMSMLLPLGVAIWMLAASPVRADEYLHLDKTYHTKCLGLYEAPLVDGRYVYFSQGFVKDNYFSRLDVLTGACERAASVPSMEFHPKTASADYLFANDGIYERHSVYRKSDWKRFGSLRLKDSVQASAIDGDTLYLVQWDYSAGPKTYLTAFSLPDLKLKKTEDLNFTGARVLPFGHSFLLYDDDHLVVYDFRTGESRRADLAMSSRRGTVELPDGSTAGIGCGRDGHLLDDTTALLHSSCHSYAVVNLATLKPRFDVTLANGGTLAKGFVAGPLLYLLVESTKAPTYTHGGQHDDIQVVDYATGHAVASPPPLVSDNYTNVFQVDGRLIWAAYDQKAQDFRVDVYRLKPQP